MLTFTITRKIDESEHGLQMHENNCFLFIMNKMIQMKSRQNDKDFRHFFASPLWWLMCFVGRQKIWSRFWVTCVHNSHSFSLIWFPTIELYSNLTSHLYLLCPVWYFHVLSHVLIFLQCPVWYLSLHLQLTTGHQHLCQNLHPCDHRHDLVVWSEAFFSPSMCMPMFSSSQSGSMWTSAWWSIDSCIRGTSSPSLWMSRSSPSLSSSLWTSTTQGRGSCRTGTSSLSSWSSSPLSKIIFLFLRVFNRYGMCSLSLGFFSTSVWGPGFPSSLSCSWWAAKGRGRWSGSRGTSSPSMWLRSSSPSQSSSTVWSRGSSSSTSPASLSVWSVWSAPTSVPRP